ncbi:MAG: 50S ribosomal protein L6 [Candidatus Aenigmarchaeota archaeon]|nr:50S ribosomal protein L6 [Candidatus Aenigmarchaeota archaeon]
MIEKKIEVPEHVDVSVEGKKVVVKGSKGSLERSFSDPRFVRTLVIEKQGREIAVRSSKDTKKHRAMVGTIEAHLKNMFLGVSSGYAYRMKIFYTHFPINITVKDGEVQIRNFLGEKGARTAKIVGKAEVKLDKDEIVINGTDKEELGQTAANIEHACKISKRDRRIFQDGVYLASRGVSE